MIPSLSLEKAVWLFCPAFALHVLEEWPRFTGWAKRYASPRYTQRDYNVIHTAGVAASLLAALIVWRFPNRPVTFMSFAFVFARSVLFNAFFHVGASVLTRSYCPGMITAVVIYLPLFALIADLAYQEGLLDVGSLLVTLAIAGVFHIWEVGHNVFKAW